VTICTFPSLIFILEPLSQNFRSALIIRLICRFNANTYLWICDCYRF